MGAITGLQWPWLILIGTVVGTVSGSLGVGSAIILIPALIFFLDIPQKNAQGMSLLVMAPMVLMAAIRYCNNPSVHINPWTVTILAVAAVIGANIGSSIAFLLPADMLKKGFAVFIIGAGIFMLVK